MLECKSFSLLTPCLQLSPCGCGAFLRLLGLILTICFSTTNEAAEFDAATPSLCEPIENLIPEPPAVEPLAEDQIRLYADTAELQELESTLKFRGNVVVQKGEQLLQSPEVRYDQATNTAESDKEFTFWDRNFVVTGTGFRLSGDDAGQLDNAAYQLRQRRGSGEADSITQQSRDIVELDNATFTTCDPNKRVWHIKAQSSTLDNTTAVGVSRNATVHFLGIPIFYTPYISYPLNDERKTGFLAPSIGTSDEAGTEFSIPFYWNIHPSYDATFTPRVMSRRGVLLNTEFRYLLAQGQGILEFEYLPDDRSAGETRSSLDFKHASLLRPRLYTVINVEYVSDDRYFEELGNNLVTSSIVHLERRADLVYLGDNWQALARVQRFQTLDRNPFSRPYERMPQLLFRTQLPERNGRLNWAFQAEFAHFERDLEEFVSTTGNRFDLLGSLSYPWRTPGTFLVPKLSLRHTQYFLSNYLDNLEDDQRQRTLYTASVDGGLIFERDFQARQQSFVQTLEPRVFYRYTPYREQADLPLFDTAEYDLSFWQLFRENRYSGADRIDDGHQVTLALTSRLFGENTGVEHIRASIGQIYYFADREVRLPGQTIETEDSSSIVAEIASQASDAWQAAITHRWNPHNNENEHTVLRLRYQPDSTRIVNASYRLRDESIEQTDLSGYWQLSPRWNMIGRWNYSLREHKDLETFYGLQYNSCCWAVRAIMRRYLNTVDGEGYHNGIFLEFQLKGLGGIGRKADTFLELSIPGYADEF